MLLRWSSLALPASLIAATATATAQQHPARSDTTRAEIHRTLRAFYFNLAHDDWEALTADILPAKVVAHRSAPEALVAGGASGAGGEPLDCASSPAPQIDRAAIALDGDWAEVSVPRCSAPLGADEFRLIRFERRWRFVHIQLFQEPRHVVTER
jgi:hypothetical protein